MRILKHSLFWILVTIFLTTMFGYHDQDYPKALMFVTFLLPGAMGTSYLFNYYLVPNYLLPKHYVKFGIYLLYTLIFSLYLEMIALVLALILLANYHYQNLNPYATNLILLTSTLYLIVFINAFILLVKRYRNKEIQVNTLQDLQEKNKIKEITIRSDRKNHPIRFAHILYMESLGDYIKIHTINGPLLTKDKISSFSEYLPDNFMRTHRSFIVNRDHILSYTNETIQLKESQIPISRTYKKFVLSNLPFHQGGRFYPKTPFKNR